MPAQTQRPLLPSYPPVIPPLIMVPTSGESGETRPQGAGEWQLLPGGKATPLPWYCPWDMCYLLSKVWAPYITIRSTSNYTINSQWLVQGSCIRLLTRRQAYSLQRNPPKCKLYLRVGKSIVVRWRTGVTPLFTASSPSCDSQTRCVTQCNSHPPLPPLWNTPHPFTHTLAPPLPFHASSLSRGPSQRIDICNAYLQSAICNLQCVFAIKL